MKRFTIRFPDVDLSVEDVWPDGDAPAGPTPRDVVERMKSTGRAVRVAADWELIDEIEVWDGNVRACHR